MGFSYHTQGEWKHFKQIFGSFHSSPIIKYFVNIFTSFIRSRFMPSLKLENLTHGCLSPFDS